jgi:hypothetical protein
LGGWRNLIVQAPDGADLPRQGLIVLDEFDVADMGFKEICPKQFGEIASVVRMQLRSNLDDVRYSTFRELHVWPLNLNHGLVAAGGATQAWMVS